MGRMVPHRGRSARAECRAGSARPPRPPLTGAHTDRLAEIDRGSFSPTRPTSIPRGPSSASYRHQDGLCVTAVPPPYAARAATSVRAGDARPGAGPLRSTLAEHTDHGG